MILRYILAIPLVVIAATQYYKHKEKSNARQFGYEYVDELMARNSSELKTKEEKIKFLKRKLNESRKNNDYTGFEEGVETRLSEILREM